jgi:protein-disulfide isomerase
VSGKLVPPVSDADHSQGSSTAVVTLVEYGDFECSYCGMAYPIIKSIQQQMGDDLRFVFREFPLTEVHPHAQHAAEAAEAAAQSGKFWEMHDILYEHQSRLADDDLLRYAADAGLDPDEVARALEDGTCVDAVRDQFMSGVRSGVNGTPTFFVNGKRYDGLWNNEAVFLQALTALT